MNISTLLDPGAILPHRAHADDVGYDIHALTVTIEQFDDTNHNWYPVTGITPFTPIPQSAISRIIIDTGVHLTPPQGYYIELVPNSRISKSIFRWSFTPGIIDPNYTGSIKAILEPRHFRFGYNHSLLPRPGTVVGQLIIRKKYDATFTPVSSLPSTTRGSNGFGSTSSTSIRNS